MLWLTAQVHSAAFACLPLRNLAVDDDAKESAAILDWRHDPAHLA